MKSFFCVFVVLAMNACFFTTAIEAEEAPSQPIEAIEAEEAPPEPIEAIEALYLEVADAAICEDVVDRAPVGTGTSFGASVGKLYCFTKITGAQTSTTVTHIWYCGETERARVPLDIGSASWRTKSSKIIQPHEIGSWHVDVVDADGKVLRSLQFMITPEIESVPETVGDVVDTGVGDVVD